MRFRLLNDMLSPLAIGLNAIPIFVLVAVFNNMFAITSEIPRRLMVTLVVYFIVLVNVAKGLRQVEAHAPRAAALVRRDADAGARKARIPNAVPYLFPALTIAAPVAVITAFVSEYFGGTQNGLGSRITVEHDRQHRGGLGLRARRLPARAGVLPDLHRLGEHHHTHRGGSPGGGPPHEEATQDASAGVLALALVAAAAATTTTTSVDATRRRPAPQRLRRPRPPTGRGAGRDRRRRRAPRRRRDTATRRHRSRR